mmetsp:Transcript_33150/g.74140  ORF Transcript_33150/g.74140 Transcript_33150/m.74140 type:complete len:246 (-) Transcript_33150:140-877(-)
MGSACRAVCPARSSACCPPSEDPAPTPGAFDPSPRVGPASAMTSKRSPIETSPRVPSLATTSCAASGCLARRSAASSKTRGAGLSSDSAATRACAAAAAGSPPRRAAVAALNLATPRCEGASCARPSNHTAAGRKWPVANRRAATSCSASAMTAPAFKRSAASLQKYRKVCSHPCASLPRIVAKSSRANTSPSTLRHLMYSSDRLVTPRASIRSNATRAAKVLTLGRDAASHSHGAGYSAGATAG